MIEAHELVKRFGKVVAVDGLSFTAHAGEVFGLLGPNGAGKTTTLRLLATVLEPNAGSATVGGYDIRTQKQKVRSIVGLLVEDAGLYSRVTAREHLRYFGRLHGLNGSDLKKRMDFLIDVLGIAEFADRQTEGFSRGMQRRVVMAIALIHAPQVVILDEPTIGLDVVSTRAVRDLIAAFRAEGRCVIISTHLMDEVQRLCDRVGIIYDGKLMDQGTPRELMARTGTPDLETAFVETVGAERLLDVGRPPRPGRLARLVRRLRGQP
ncbi:MAG: ATP-binding cassette domain-containing protein [Anaerolineae bacterium]|nr:ATP-binding cassette domain-containing protein [Anaerolineae bacterium]